MPRLSVYVPDDLLERAKTLQEEGDDNTSRLVQQGLDLLVASKTPHMPEYARAPGVSQMQLMVVSRRLRADAQTDYQRGYAAAVQAAAAIPLQVLNELADADFDLEEWLEPHKNRLRDELLGCVGKDGLWLNNDPEDMRREFEQSNPPKAMEWAWLWRTSEALGALANPFGFDRSSEPIFRPTNPTRRGYADAMRWLWRMVERPEDDGDVEEEN